MAHRQPPNKQKVHVPDTGPPRRVCFSFAAYAKNVISHLRRCQVPIARGLTEEEFTRIESMFAFVFPPDLRSILEEGLPVGVGFPNWRSGNLKQLRTMVERPVSGICSEVIKGTFWCKYWPQPPPLTKETALKVAKTELSKYPRLVPIYSHCYIPSISSTAGNPVLFVYGSDVRYCGYDVADFFEREAFVPLNFKVPTESTVPVKGKTGHEFQNGNSPSEGLTSRFEYFHHEGKMCEDVVKRFTMRAPVWVAKGARRIEFWSDLIENKSALNVAPAHGLFAQAKENKNVSCFNPTWARRYVEEIGVELRQAGWTDTEVAEMLSPPTPTAVRKVQGRENLMHEFATSLRNAGWSAQDVMELFPVNVNTSNDCGK